MAAFASARVLESVIYVVDNRLALDLLVVALSTPGPNSHPRY